MNLIPSVGPVAASAEMNLIRCTTKSVFPIMIVSVEATIFCSFFVTYFASSSLLQFLGRSRERKRKQGDGEADESMHDGLNIGCWMRMEWNC